jgi:GntR family transcriptional regulator, transcriptional repressor for pyruvate dehydrogenase complex
VAETAIPTRNHGALRPVSRAPLYVQLIERLVEYIDVEGLQPGDRLPPERALAESLGVSRVSLRQAITALEVQHIVEVRHGGGVSLVRNPHDAAGQLEQRRRRIPDVLETREALETKLAELAAIRRTDDDLYRMEQALQAMEQAIKRGENGAQEDALFHGAVAAAARNGLLADLMAHIDLQVTETRVESLSQPGRPPKSLRAHRRIAEAIRTGDPKRAAAAMRAHLKVVGDVAL